MSGSTLPRNFSRYPMICLAVYFASGVVLGSYLRTQFTVLLAASLVLGLLCIVWQKMTIALLPLTFFATGMLCCEVETIGIADNRIKRIYEDGRIASGEPVEIEGVLLGTPEPAYGGVFLLVRTERLRHGDIDLTTLGKIRLFVVVDDSAHPGDFEQLNLNYGSRVCVFGRLEREEKFQNPGTASRVKMLDQQDIDATATIKSTLLIEKLGDESVFLPFAWVYAQRQRLITSFREDLSPQTAGVMIASLLGDQHFLDRETSDIFREGGTFHVLVISGLHITFIGGLTIWLVSFFAKREIYRFILATSFLWAYTLAVGAGVPVMRASLMFTILLFSRVIYRPGSLLNTLGLCVILLLVWKPSDMFAPSFQLTIVSVTAIVGCAFPLIEKLRAIGGWMPNAGTPLPPMAGVRLRRLCELLYWNDVSWKIENSRQIWSANLFKSPYLKRLARGNLQQVTAYIFEGVVVSLIVQVWMLPLLVIYFHRVTPVSVALNLWVGILLAVESFAALFAVLLGGISAWLGAPLIVLTELLNTLMMSVPTWFSGNRLASFRVPVYTGGFRIIYFLYALILAVTAYGIFRWEPFDRSRWSNSGRLLTSASLFLTLALGVTITFHPYSAPAIDGKLKVDFLDVGQGDSALVTFPNGETMLIDGGGRPQYRDDEESSFEPDTPRIGETVVSEFLWEKGYSKVDYLVSTHPDADHIQGLNDVARNFDVGVLLAGWPAAENTEFLRLLSLIEGQSAHVQMVRAGDELMIGGSTVRILSPPIDFLSDASSNNSSVVLSITYGSRTFLLTGDIERQAEAGILGAGADVVKVPHHGSRTSSTAEFVANVDAEFAVISVGRKSPFGHPHREVVDRWTASGAQVRTTGERGTISVTTDGSDLQLSTFLP